jgi:predicted alpha/beta hydrolase family esterase
MIRQAWIKLFCYNAGMKRVVILHGNGNSHGTDNWYPYIKSALEDMGVECLTPDLPDNILARKQYWFPYFTDVLKLGPDDIVIGASSGALAIMKYAEDHKIGATILVGTYYTDLGYEDERTSGYFDTPWHWEKIKANQKWSAIFASTDDPYIPISEPQYIRDQLGSEYFEFNDRGHFGGETHPILELPELLTFLKEKLV